MKKAKINKVRITIKMLRYQGRQSFISQFILCESLCLSVRILQVRGGSIFITISFFKFNQIRLVTDKKATARAVDGCIELIKIGSLKCNVYAF